MAEQRALWWHELAERKAAQERGEVARADGSTHHRPKVSEPRTPSAATLPDLGIPRQRAAEAKALAERRYSLTTRREARIAARLA
jgi:hypothetical protein